MDGVVTDVRLHQSRFETIRDTSNAYVWNCFTRFLKALNTVPGAEVVAMPPGALAIR